jgi:hypothetical protein
MNNMLVAAAEAAEAAEAVAVAVAEEVEVVAATAVEVEVEVYHHYIHKTHSLNQEHFFQLQQNMLLMNSKMNPIPLLFVTF